MRIEYFEDRYGAWRWRLVLGNSKIIADGAEGYGASTTVLRAIDRVKKAFISGQIKVVRGKAKRGK